MTNLSQAFEAFHKGLDPAEAPADAVLQRHKIREHIASAWSPVRDAVIGSYRRGTNIRPTREIEFLFVLGTRLQSYLTNDPVKVLDDVSARLGVPYPHVRARRSVHGLAMPFGDFTVMLVPGFPKHGGGVYIPDTELRRWMPTDPDAQAAFVNEVNRKTGGNAVMVIRALKCWRRAHQVPIRSFHLEVLALRALSSRPESFAAGCLTALEGVASAVKLRCAPVGPVGDDVDQYLALEPQRRAKIAQAASDAVEALRDASAHEAQQLSAAACQTVRLVFGAPFPEG